MISHKRQVGGWIELTRVAISTKADGGLEDVVSSIFGKANTFTVVDIQDGTVKLVKVLKNPAASYKQGAGPTVVKMLADSDVNAVLSGEFGPGVSALLEQHHITMIKAKPGIVVSEAIKKVSWSQINIHI